MQDRRLHCRHLTKVFPRWMRSASKSDGAPLQIDVVDDYTFRISFAERYDGFPAYLSIVQWKGYTEFVKPAHYQDRAGYEVVLLDMHVTPTDARLNLTYDDPVWREVVNDVRFRRALSHAINREEIIDAIYFGFATPSTFVPASYDPELANRLLDEMGMDQRDGQGFRLGPDGKTFEIPFEIAMHASDQVPVTEMVTEYWKDVGIKATMKTIEPGLQATRRNANELQADLLWHHGPELWWGALWDFVPSAYGRAWFTWFNTAGAEGEEPPEDVKKFMAAMDRSIALSGAERDAAIEEVREMMMENVYIILNVEDVKYPLIVNKNLGNVPTGGFAGHAAAAVGAGPGDRAHRHRQPDPGDAQHAVGRVAQAVRGHRARQGRGRADPAVQVSRAHRHQPAHQHHRLAAAVHRFG